MSRPNIFARLKDKTRLLLLVGVMALVAVAIAGVSIVTLYSISVDAEKARLVGMVEAQAHLLEAVARFDQQFSAEDHPGGARAATIAQVLDAFQHYRGFGESGEFVLAERKGAEISFLASRRRSGSATDFKVPWGSRLAEPMRRALLGQSGTILASDYAGVAVLAAYAPVAELDLGFVAKIDLSEMRRPFIRAAIFSILGGAVILLVGVLLFRIISAPILQREEAEAQYRLLLESTAEAIYGIDLDGNCTFVNPACVRILGYRDQSQLLGKNMHVVMHHTRPDGTEYPMQECKIYQAFREGKGTHIDNEILWRADGSSFPAEYWSHPIIRGGEVIGSVVTFLDITARRQAEKSARREGARLSGILELAVDAVVSVGEDQRIQIFNGGAEVIFGYTADEVIGKPIEMLLPVRTRQVHEKYMANFEQSGHPRRMGSARSEIMGLRKNGSEFPAEASVSRIEVGGEKLFTATLRDLTQRKEAEATLLREKAQAEEYLNIAGSLIMALDVDGRITLMNESARKTLEYENEEVVGKLWLETFAPEDEVSDRHQWYLDWLVGDGQEVEANTVTVVTRSGKHLLTRWHNRAIRDESGNAVGALCSGEDITGQRQTEMQLRQAQKMEAVGQLTSGIAHDFNNILAVVLGNLEYASERAEQGKDTAKQLDLAQQAAERGADLNQRLLAFSRGQSMESEPVDVVGIIAGMGGLLERALGEKIEFVTSLPDSLPKSLLDTTQLESTILNMAINARDAMPDGGVFGVTVSLADQAGPSGSQMISIRAWDTGTGMTEEVRERAMEPFFTTKEVGQGSGLGLSMVYGFAEQSGGEMKITSELGGGTMVEILLPAMVGQDSKNEEAAASQDILPEDQDSTILVVEDQLEVREIVVTNLESLGYRVLVAADGRDALNILEAQNNIDLLLSDMVMPGMNGKEIAAAARAMIPGLRCLFMSGFPEKGTDGRFSSATDIRILRKPFTKKVLAKTIQECLGKSQGPDPGVVKPSV
jgi:PAS domain S-box-containing protein